jgi:hypothetical protein
MVMKMKHALLTPDMLAAMLYDLESVKEEE